MMSDEPQKQNKTSFGSVTSSTPLGWQSVFQNQNKTPFWPVTTIFLSGIILLLFVGPMVGIMVSYTLCCLNLLRTYNTKSAVLCFGIGILFTMLLIWSSFDNRSVAMRDFSWSWLLLGLHVVVMLIFCGCMGYLSYRKIKTFEQRDLAVKKIWGWAGIVIAVGLYITSIGLYAGLNYVAILRGACRLPSLYDMIAYRTEPVRHGLEVALLQEQDLGCDFTPSFYELSSAIIPEGAMEADRVSINGRYHRVSCSMDQIAWRYDEIISRALFESQSELKTTRPSLPEFPGSSYGESFRKIYCATYPEDNNDARPLKYCSIFVAYRYTFLKTTILTDLPDEDLASMIEMILSSTSERVREYEASLP